MKITFAPKVELSSYFVLQTNEEGKLYLNRILLYVRGPAYLLQNFEDMNQKHTLRQKLVQAKEKPKFESVLFDLIRKLLVNFLKE
jgi:hypothetical protein